ncbi:RNA polymerase sigma factor [Nevskia sp.]|uniref:RNA polymerase sigma factor n=1 Tax=Nevskia sp. TaxID=1929292 RepID=UPI0025F29190|nr:RNA polymerase sigma factor [Nevskia sp.]
MANCATGFEVCTEWPESRPTSKPSPMMALLSPPAFDDADLADVVLAGAGDRLAFARIVGRNIDALIRFAERMLGSRAEAEDVVQDVFLRAWKQTANWRSGEARFSTWLHRVAMSRCIDRVRGRRETSLDDISLLASSDMPPDHGLQQQSVALRVQLALAGLAERQRAAVILCHYEEMTNIEAAATLEISVDALESLLARGRRALRAALLPERQSLIGDLT